MNKTFISVEDHEKRMAVKDFEINFQKEAAANFEMDLFSAKNKIDDLEHEIELLKSIIDNYRGNK